MKFKLLLIVIITSLSLAVKAKTRNEYFIENPNKACQKLNKTSGVISVYECSLFMFNDSNQMLQKRITAIEEEIKSYSDKEINNAFSLDQSSWESYKKDQCDYMTTEIDKKSMLYQTELNLCIAVENYRRIETLDGEPSFP